jgi:hypothetical protein
MHRRATPGDGTFDLDRFASTPLDQLPIPEFALLAHDSTARYWR